MKKNKFEVGHIIKSDCGDTGLVLKTGMRPDVDTEKMGVYAYWINEQFSFWMDIDEPGLSLTAEKERKYEC